MQILEALKYLLTLVSGYKTYASAVAAVAAALLLILGGDWLHGLPALYAAVQALLALASGATVVSLRMAIAKVSPPS